MQSFDGVLEQRGCDPLSRDSRKGRMEPFRRPVARQRAFVTLVSVALAAGCGARTPPVTPMPYSATLVRASPRAVGMDAALTATLDSLVLAALGEGAAPGAALAVGRHGRLVHLRAYGRTDTAAAAPAITDSTRFDLASLTKVIGTTTAAMILEEEGRLDLEQPLHAYLPEFDAPEKAGITVGSILAHRGGFVSGAPLWRSERGHAAFLRRMNERALAYTPGDSTIYSDWDLILTGHIVERITGQRLDTFLEQRVWRPLGLRDTGFNPLTTQSLSDETECTGAYRDDHPLLAHIAATEIDTVFRHRRIHGIVHDENACALGGVAGHAGLFSSARDLAVFAQMMLNGGAYGGVSIVQPTTIARWTARQGPRSSRALGWDTPAPGSTAGRFFSPRSFGHTGFTGTSIWMDPETGVFVVLLTNRVNPTRANMRHEPLRRAIADAVQQAIVDAPVRQWREAR
jgi:CubicO group peptidase (beta-lactamase class C family)